MNKEKFLRYEDVRISGRYNMITDSYYAMQEAGLTKKEYFEIIKNYSAYKKMFMEE